MSTGLKIWYIILIVLIVSALGTGFYMDSKRFPDNTTEYNNANMEGIDTDITFTLGEAKNITISDVSSFDTNVKIIFNFVDDSTNTKYYLTVDKFYLPDYSWDMFNTLMAGETISLTLTDVQEESWTSNTMYSFDIVQK